MSEDASSASATTSSGWQLRPATSVPAGQDGGKKRRTDEQEEADSAAPKVAPAKGKSKAKGKGKSGQSATLNDPVLSAMARLTLQSAQQHMVWEASLLTTFLGPTDSAVITSMRESGVRYHQETQTSDAARRAQLGPPHVHVFGAMIGALVTQISTITPLLGFAEQLRRIAAWLGTASLEPVVEMVTVARLSRTRQPNQTRVQIRVNHETHAASIRALCSVGFRHMCGTAPPGHHERVLSKHLSGQESSQ